MRARLPIAIAAALIPPAFGAAAAGAAPMTRQQLVRAAEHGTGVRQILLRAFPRTHLTRQAGASVRVLLAGNLTSMVLNGRTPLAVTDEGRWRHPVQRPLEPDHRYRVTRRGTRIVLRDLDSGRSRVYLGPIRIDSLDARTGIRIADPFDSRYRGSLRVLANRGNRRMQLVNEVSLEDYLRGVLPGEVPIAGEPPAALRAEVIAFRSRTFARLRGRAFSYDVDSLDPRYVGMDGERPSTNAAVRSSQGLALMLDRLPFEASFPGAGQVPVLKLTPAEGAPDPVAKAPSRPIPGATPGLGQTAVQLALDQVGVPYRWGGSSPSGFDCSGLTSYVFGRLGIALPRVAEDQARVGQYVPRDQLQPGDTVFFADSSGYIHHMGLYIGNGKMVHAPHTGDVVRIADITSGYYARQYAGARRYSPSVDVPATTTAP